MVLTSKDYRLAALSLSAAVQFREWVKREVLAEARERIALMDDFLDPSERRGILQNALALIDSGQAEKVITDSPEGKRMIVWLSLLPNHPEITLQQAGALVPRFAENAEALDERLAEANGLTVDAPAEGRGKYHASIDDRPSSPETARVDGAPPTPGKPILSAIAPQEARRIVFDGMCQNNGLTAQDLVDLPIAAAEALYFKELGKPISKTFDRLRLKAYLLEYAAAQTAAKPAEEMPAAVKAAVDVLNAQAPQTMQGMIDIAPSEVIGGPPQAKSPAASPEAAWADPIAKDAA
jgi:hypothetical protein